MSKGWRIGHTKCVVVHEHYVCIWDQRMMVDPNGTLSTGKHVQHYKYYRNELYSRGGCGVIGKDCCVIDEVTK